MRINANFDGGNIDVISNNSPDDIQLAIKPDVGNEFFQWFNFRLHGQVGQHYKLSLMNASQSSYSKGWEDYNAVASYDRQQWFRVPTEYKDGKLIIDLQLECSSIQIAYFAPYSYERHLDLISSVQLHPAVCIETLGETIDKRDISLIKVGDENPEKKSIWIIARQHPGETMAEWLIEGLLNQLLSDDNPNSKALLDKANFYIVPNMNPDGSARGHLRTNAVGVNLNREWANPSIEKSPEVFHVINKMKQTGVDCFYDVHGDEGLPYVFLAGCEGIPNWDQRLAKLQQNFVQALTFASADFQSQYGYDVDKPGEANLDIAANWVANKFNCLSNTLEMPFKDNHHLSDPFAGWSPERSALLGEASLLAILAVIDQL